jgi:hypothetical protein
MKSIASEKDDGCDNCTHTLHGGLACLHAGLLIAASRLFPCLFLHHKEATVT